MGMFLALILIGLTIYAVTALIVSQGKRQRREEWLAERQDVWVKMKQENIEKYGDQYTVPHLEGPDAPSVSTGDLIRCPKMLCGSTQISADKRGYSLLKGAAGYVLTGGIPVALLAGFHGSGKIELTCLKCGNTWRP